MKFISTKNSLGKIKKSISTLALGLLAMGTAQAEITDFQAYTNQCNAVLTWESDGRPDISFYEVQKSLDGINFSTIRSIRATSSASYSHTTRQHEARVQYRIVENYRNSDPITSSVKTLKEDCGSAALDTPAIGFYPNPMFASIGGDLHITLENESAKTLNIQITDITGRVILEQENELYRGLNQVDMNVGSLAVGSYLIVTSADGGSPNASRFIVQK